MSDGAGSGAPGLPGDGSEAPASVLSVAGALVSELAKAAWEEAQKYIRFEPPNTLFVVDSVIVSLVEYFDDSDIGREEREQRSC
jgi:hypothetical protein